MTIKNTVIKKAAKITAKPAAGKLPAKKSAGKVGIPVKPGATLTAKRAAVVAAPEKTVKQIKKEHKKKVVRDSFTMPQDEYQKIAEIKATCLKAKMHVKKSEVLRAGLKILAELSAAQLKQVLNDLEKIKTGRPQKH